MKVLKKLCLIFIICSIFSCGYAIRVHHFIEPVSRLDVTVTGGSVLMRSLYSDIVVESVDNDNKFLHLKSSGIFKPDNVPLSQALPPNYKPASPSFVCLMIVMRNRTNEPIEKIKTYLSKDGEIFDELDSESLKRTNIPENIYGVSLLKMFSMRRLIAGEPYLEQIKFAVNTIRYDSKWVLPGDAVVFFRVYNIHPVNVEEFKLFVEINSGEINHVVNMDFKQIKFREDSKNYKNYKRKIDEEKKGRRILWL